MKNRTYDDDDGRVIADMSDLQRQPMLLPRLPKRKKESGEPDASPQPQPELELTKEERRSYVRGAIGATLLIAGIFIAAAAIVITLLLLLWH